MPPNFHSILYDFFIKGHDLNFIAGTYETSWYEVAEVLDSDLAKKYMRCALRVERIRAAGKMLRSRLAAIQTLQSTIETRRDSSHSSIESRRRAAAAILSATTQRGRSGALARARPLQKATPPTTPTLSIPPLVPVPARPASTPQAAPSANLEMQSASPAPGTSAPKRPVKHKRTSHKHTPLKSTAPSAPRSSTPLAAPSRKPARSTLQRQNSS